MDNRIRMKGVWTFADARTGKVLDTHENQLTWALVDKVGNDIAGNIQGIWLGKGTTPPTADDTAMADPYPYYIAGGAISYDSIRHTVRLSSTGEPMDYSQYHEIGICGANSTLYSRTLYDFAGIAGTEITFTWTLYLEIPEGD